MSAFGRWSVVWHWLRRRLDNGPRCSDVEEARRRRTEAEYELEYAKGRRPAVEQAADRLRRHQEERDFTALVEETFMRRRQ